MTPEQHNKYVALAHLANAGIYLLMMGFMLFMFLVMIVATPTHGPGGPPPLGFFVVMCIFLVGMTIIFALPSLFAAYGFWKRKTWARTAGIIGAVMAATNFPVGVAACVYTFWFLFSDPGKSLYEKPQYHLPPPPPRWAEGAGTQIRNYSESRPPDWR